MIDQNNNAVITEKSVIITNTFQLFLAAWGGAYLKSVASVCEKMWWIIRLDTEAGQINPGDNSLRKEFGELKKSAELLDVFFHEGALEDISIQMEQQLQHDFPFVKPVFPVIIMNENDLRRAPTSTATQEGYVNRLVQVYKEIVTTEDVDRFYKLVGDWSGDIAAKCAEVGIFIKMPIEREIGLNINTNTVDADSCGLEETFDEQLYEDMNAELDAPDQGEIDRHFLAVQEAQNVAYADELSAGRPVAQGELEAEMDAHFEASRPIETPIEGLGGHSTGHIRGTDERTGIHHCLACTAYHFSSLIVRKGNQVSVRMLQSWERLHREFLNEAKVAHGFDATAIVDEDTLVKWMCECDGWETNACQFIIDAKQFYAEAIRKTLPEFDFEFDLDVALGRMFGQAA